MTEYKSYDREIKDRGQLTIPKKIREAVYKATYGGKRR